MRKSVVWILAAVAIAAALWWGSRGSAPNGVAGGVVAVDAGARAAVEARAPAPPPATARVKRDELRERIVRRLEERTVAPDARTAAAAPVAQGGATTEPKVRPPGNLRDRTGGGRNALLKQLNHDLMPLVDECIEQAQERVPGLVGMIAINLETVADEELGAVVDVAEAAPTNGVPDPGLLECIRESALSMTLPAHAVSGRDKVMLTIPVDAIDARVQ